MNLRNQIFCFVMLLAGLANGQQMSAQWHSEIAASWGLVRAEFPGCDRPPSPFFARIREIDAWAKGSNEALYLNSNRPYLMAQMVQREIDENARAEKHAAETEERRKALAEEAATIRQTKLASQIIVNGTSIGDTGRSGLTGSALGTIWIGSTIIIIITFAIAWAIHWIIRPRHGAISATALGRKWAAWIVALGTISSLPRFFHKLDANSFVLWAMGVTIFGASAFFLGWIVGLFKFRRKDGQESSPPASPSGWQRAEFSRKPRPAFRWQLLNEGGEGMGR